MRLSNVNVVRGALAVVLAYHGNVNRVRTIGVQRNGPLRPVKHARSTDGEIRRVLAETQFIDSAELL